MDNDGLGTVNLPIKEVVSVNAIQEINVSALREFDAIYDKPKSGKAILHEVTEAYIAVFNSKISKVSAPPSIGGIKNLAYEVAHEGAIQQPGDGVAPFGYNSIFYDIKEQINNYKSKGLLAPSL